jgi:hypothetical protein
MVGEWGDRPGRGDDGYLRPATDAQLWLVAVRLDRVGIAGIPSQVDDSLIAIDLYLQYLDDMADRPRSVELREDRVAKVQS